MSSPRLSENRIETLKPRKRPYDIRDSELKGFGVRVLPSGAVRFFIHSQHEGRRVWKTIGDDGVVELEEARRRATALLAAIRRDETLPEERLFEAVAEEVFARYGRNWKPGTMKVNRTYLRNRILPWFGGMNIADITKQGVQRWFASLRATPVAADRSAPVLSVIMRHAELYGYRPEGSNPCTGIRRYRRKGRERFLSEQELRRLGMVLDSASRTIQPRTLADRPAGDPQPSSRQTPDTGLRASSPSIGYRSPQCRGRQLPTVHRNGVGPRGNCNRVMARPMIVSPATSSRSRHTLRPRRKRKIATREGADAPVVQIMPLFPQATPCSP